MKDVDPDDPSYTPITNAAVLHSAATSLDLCNVNVTLYRGYLRITGVSEVVKFQPAVGDIISGGWDLINNEFGKGVLSVNQFLLRLMCRRQSRAWMASTRYFAA